MDTLYYNLVVFYVLDRFRFLVLSNFDLFSRNEIDIFTQFGISLYLYMLALRIEMPFQTANFYGLKMEVYIKFLAWLHDFIMFKLLKKEKCFGIGLHYDTILF